MGKTAFIYCRISQDRNGAGLGVTRQRRDCEALAEREGYAVSEVFTDNDVSAYSGKPRPGYCAMLERVAEVDAVIVWHTDRLHRSPAELERWIDATGGERTARVITLTVQAGSLDLTTADGRMRARISGVVARHESEHKAERARRKMEQIARSGGWTGGTRPFGWDATPEGLVLNETEAEVVRETTAAVIQGQSLGSLVSSLNERGILTTTARPWGYAQLRQMLMRPRNAGIAVHHGEEVGRTVAPAIVSEAQYRAVVAVLSDPRRRRSQTNRARHLLAGIARCHCGELVRSATVTNGKGDRLPTYRCPAKGAGHVGKRIAYVDPFVARWAAFGRLWNLREAEAPEVGAERLELEAERLALDSRSEAIAQQIASGAILPEQIATVNAGIVAQREALQSRMAELEVTASRRALPELLPEEPSTFAQFMWERSRLEAFQREADAEWSGLSIDQRRDWIRTHLDVVLLPQPAGSRRRFDPATVSLGWK